MYKEKLKEMPLPPQPILTRWGTWLQAAMFYSEHFDSIKEVVMSFDGSSAVAIQKAQSIMKKPGIKNQLIYVRSAGEPVEEDRSGLEIVQEELQPYVAADIGFLHEGHRPYASADHFRHPVGPASSPRIPPENRTSHRTVPGRGTRVQEQLLSGKFHVIRPEVTSPETTRQLALGGEEGPPGLSEDTDGVIDQRRKRGSEDFPPAHSSRDSLWIPSFRPGNIPTTSVQQIPTISTSPTTSVQQIPTIPTISKIPTNSNNLNNLDHLADLRISPRLAAIAITEELIINIIWPSLSPYLRRYLIEPSSTAGGALTTTKRAS
ncbi:hypothetical protein GEV33_004090 [Tenebrio molitor]|uniref:Uncharacterized protein n=1 Tax=Tenebrio molitor TaxID=7067 RepID=A0A8J6HQF6_TENMO|nr:hypothetical protein GEV33_004090 [Tenebrio molitor]